MVEERADPPSRACLGTAIVATRSSHLGFIIDTFRTFWLLLGEDYIAFSGLAGCFLARVFSSLFSLLLLAYLFDYISLYTLFIDYLLLVLLSFLL